VSEMKKNINEVECLVCNGIHFRKGFFVAEYQKYDEDTRWNQKAEAKIQFNLESEEDNPLNRLPEQSNIYSYICEDCGFIMHFNKEKQVESKKQERMRKQRKKMYDWTKFK
jgi:hypothetical protein